VGGCRAFTSHVTHFIGRLVARAARLKKRNLQNEALDILRSDVSLL
jgi:hypothetical protein